MYISTAAKSRCHHVHNMLFRIKRDSVPNVDIDVGDGSWTANNGCLMDTHVLSNVGEER